MTLQTHWENIYQAKGPAQVSWYQAHAEMSLRLIRGTGAGLGEPLIDVGGGASTLVDDLLAAGFSDVTVLDLSATALALAQQRLGEAAGRVTWVQAEITRAELPRRHYAVWHDRAVFHFLTDPADRARYVQAVEHAVRPGGHVIVATFALDGPTHCSGLPVARYSPESLQAEFGAGFSLSASAREDHRTPFGTEQKFVYCYCRKA